MNEPLQSAEFKRLIQCLRLAENPLSLSRLSEQANISDTEGLHHLLLRLVDDDIVTEHQFDGVTGTIEYSMNHDLEFNDAEFDTQEDSFDQSHLAVDQIDDLHLAKSSFGKDRALVGNEHRLDDSEKYLAKLGGLLKPLGHEQMLELVEKVKKSAEKEGHAARVELLKQFFPDIRRIALALCREKSYLMDLAQEGVLACWSGFKTFDIDRSTDLELFIVQKIERRMLRYIAKHGLTIRLPEHILSEQTKVRHARAILTQKLGYEPSENEIVAASGLSEKQVRVIVELERRGSLVSIDGPLPTPDDDASFAEQIRCPEHDDPYRAAEQADLRRQTDEMLAFLSKKEARVLRMRFGFHGGKEKSCEATAKHLKITKQTVSRTHMRGMRKLRRFERLARDLLGMEAPGDKADAVVTKAPVLQNRSSSYQLIKDRLFCATLNLLLQKQYRSKISLVLNCLKKVIRSSPDIYQLIECSDLGPLEFNPVNSYFGQFSIYCLQD